MEHPPSFVKPPNAAQSVVVCRCCGRAIDGQSADVCPFCGYPLDLAKEKRLLEALQQDLQRIAQHGGGNLRIGGLVHLTPPALQAFRRIAIYAGPNTSVIQLLRLHDLRLKELASEGVVQEEVSAVITRKLPGTEEQASPLSTAQHPRHPARPLRPARAPRHSPVVALRPLIDSPAGLMVALGTFLTLIAMLGLSFSYPGPAIAVTIGAQVFFAAMAVVTRRSSRFREFSHLYSVFFALTIPLLVIDVQQQHLLSLPTALLISLAALYACITYGAFAIYQRFSPFGYLSITALLVAIAAFLLSFPGSFALQWAASLSLLLAMAGLFTLPFRNRKRASPLDRLFNTSWAVLRSPARFYMFLIIYAVAIIYVAVAFGSILGELVGLSNMYWLGILTIRSASFLTTLLLLLAWLCLYIQQARAYKPGPLAAGLFLLCVLTFAFMQGLQQEAFGVALMGVAALYHFINRFAAKRLNASVGSIAYLDVFAVCLIGITPLIIAPGVPWWVFNFALAQNQPPVPLYGQPFSDFVAILLLLTGTLLTIDIATGRGSVGGKAPAPGMPVPKRVDSRPWLLLLSGLLFDWMIGVIGIDSSWVHVGPMWWFLLVALIATAAALAAHYGHVRRWTNPLLAIALGNALLAVALSLQAQQSTELLFFFAALSYGIAAAIERRPGAFWLTAGFGIWGTLLQAQTRIDVLLIILPCTAIAGLLADRFIRQQGRILIDSQKPITLPAGWPWYAIALTAMITLCILPAPDLGRLVPFYRQGILLSAAALLYDFGMVRRRLSIGFAGVPFACWAIVLYVRENDFLALLIVTVACVAIGISAQLFVGNVLAPPAENDKSSRSLPQLFALPLYATALFDAILTGTALPQPLALSGIATMLIFTTLAIVVMLRERVPEALVVPAATLSWIIIHANLEVWQQLLAFSLLCVLLFAARFAWKIIPPLKLWLTPTALSGMLAIGGQTIVVLVALVYGGPVAGPPLPQVGALALVVLSLLLVWSGFAQHMAKVRRWCNFGAGLVFTLALSWELYVLLQPTIAILTIPPASYLSIVAPFLMRDRDIPNDMRLGQIAAVLGALGLLVPSLLLSLGSDQPVFGSFPGNLFAMLLLLAESLSLYALGYAAHVRTFILSGAGLVVVVALLAFRYAITPGNPRQYTTTVWIILAVSGTALLLVAATLMLRRRTSVHDNSMPGS